MADREKIINNFEHEVNKAHGEGWDFVDLSTDDAKEILALLKEQEQRINFLEERLRLLEYGDQGTLQSGLMPAT